MKNIPAEISISDDIICDNTHALWRGNSISYLEYIFSLMDIDNENYWHGIVTIFAKCGVYVKLEYDGTLNWSGHYIDCFDTRHGILRYHHKEGHKDMMNFLKRKIKDLK